MKIDIFFVIIVFSFMAHRIAVMLYDFFSYGEIFGRIKLWIASKVNNIQYKIFIREIEHLTKSNAQEKSLYFYDALTNNKGFWAFVLSLIDCKFCLTIWISGFISLLLIIFLGMPLYILLFIPVFAYFLTEKI